MNNIAIFPKTQNDYKKAEKLSEKLGFPIASNIDCFNLLIIIDNDIISFSDKNMVVTGDFISLLPRTKPNNLNGEALIKAAKIKNQSKGLLLVDATAGMGEDSFLLAAAGFNVTLFEYDNIIYTLLQNSIERGLKNPEIKSIISNMNVINANSVEAMKNLSFKPDVIYLDPMFPKRQKSGLIKKKFQIIHNIENPCENELEMLKSAIIANPQKIIIKRPQKGEYLAGIKPDYSINGKSIRYDCFINPKIEKTEL